MLNENAKYKVVIVDDHALFAGSLEKLINSFFNFTAIFHVGNGLELQRKLAKEKEVPDIILLDINMPVLNGFETAEWLSSNYPDIKFLALSMDDDEFYILKMLRLGARGYLLKDIEPKELNHALNEVVNKGYFHCEKVSDALLHSIGLPKDDDVFGLREHELVFIKLASSDMTYKEIADVMNVTPKTVDNYRQIIFKKLKIKNRIGLVIFALKNNIIKI